MCRPAAAVRTRRSQGLYKQMVDLLRTLGVEPVPTVGTPFDPEIHEAIMREASNAHPDGTVLVEFRKGFRLGDKLLRAAMVQVRERAVCVHATSRGEPPWCVGVSVWLLRAAMGQVRARVCICDKPLHAAMVQVCERASVL